MGDDDIFPMDFSRLFIFVLEDFYGHARSIFLEIFLRECPPAEALPFITDIMQTQDTSMMESITQ
jgi:hypothetical protein